MYNMECMKRKIWLDTLSVSFLLPPWKGFNLYLFPCFRWMQYFHLFEAFQSFWAIFVRAVSKMSDCSPETRNYVLSFQRIPMPLQLYSTDYNSVRLCFARLSYTFSCFLSLSSHLTLLTFWIGPRLPRISWKGRENRGVWPDGTRNAIVPRHLAHRVGLKRNAFGRGSCRCRLVSNTPAEYHIA